LRKRGVEVPSNPERTSRSRKPAALGYRMPAEWEPHEATWMAWPHLRGDWPDKFEPIPWVYAEIIRHLARHERVDVIVNSAHAEKRARAVLEKADALSDNLCFHHWRTDRVWTRDSGCVFLAPADPENRTARVMAAGEIRDSYQGMPSGMPKEMRDDSAFRRWSRETDSHYALLALHFQFNAWAKYSNYKFDEKVGRRMARAAGARVVQPFSGDHRVVLEGGSVDVNGSGTLLTTEECLLSTEQQRNPPMDRVAYEQMFADYFGVQSIIWLGGGIAGDDTHGHVDDIARFVSPNTVVAMIESNAQDENYSALQHNLGRLKAARTPDGERLEIVEIPMPRPVVFEGRRLPASYANFYIANDAVLVPVFNDPNDRIALNTLAALFPSREVVPIYSGDLIWGFGALHCMTQQQPVVRSR
jgi:agmatine deiminase